MASPPRPARDPRRARLWTALVLCAVAIPFGFWIAHFQWLCDDAYISFRYAKNLADGHGLRYNPADPPIEGYSNFLWVLLLAGARRLTFDIPTTALVLSIASAAGLLIAVTLHLARHRRGPAVSLVFPLLVFVTLPPLAAWATSGLATMPTALCLFVLWDRLFGHERPRVLGATVASIGAILLRADAFLFVGVLHATAFALGSWRVPGRFRALCVSAAVAGLTFGALTAFRWWTFGDWLPNTARVKAPANALSLERGLLYDANFLLTFLAVPGLALIGLASRLRSARCASAWVFVLATFGYAVWVGGDFMAMGRLLLAALPFLAILGASGLDRLAACCRPGLLAAAALSAALVGLSVATTFERYPVPRATLERFFFRWSALAFFTEVEQWGLMKGQGLRWSTLGRALKRHTEPGESVVRGTIGAVGYYSDLYVYDTFGLTNEAWRDHPPREDKRSSPGHERHIPLTVFLDRNPTYANVELTPSTNPYDSLPIVLKRYEENLDMQWIPLPEVPGGNLRLVRWLPGARTR